MVQVPVVIKCRLEPVLEQTPEVRLAKLTARLELVVALMAKSGSPKILSLKASNVMVWFCMAAKLAMTVHASVTVLVVKVLPLNVPPHVPVTDAAI